MAKIEQATQIRMEIEGTVGGETKLFIQYSPLHDARNVTLLWRNDSTKQVAYANLPAESVRDVIKFLQRAVRAIDKVEETKEEQEAAQEPTVEEVFA